MAEITGHPTDQAGTLRALNTPAPDQGRVGRTTTRVFAITSGKGGVGKTAVVANTAVLLARMGKRVLILDADLGLANIDVVFGLAPGRNLNHFFAGEQGLESILTDGPEGIKILPAGSGVQSFTRLDSHQKMRLLEGLETMNNDFDFVLIDTEAGISENVTYFNTAAQEILVVTTPDPTAITDAYALMKLLSNQYHEKHFNLIVNFIKNEDEALDVYRKLTMVANRYLDISIDYIGSIPRDKMMVDAIRKQKVLVQLFPESKTASSFEALARTIVQEPQSIEPKGSIQFFWKRLLEIGGR
ncbi:MinD/ParA family protein [Desulfobulbus rhabdoformis]|uniref:MinD/ParA family protein n=1 Tax=Desulfobulbus rhabdoformis TaxID=34032 RepID=UPI001965EAB5|nr:MinD/ParA family protein [Desulfobulbus rhabdoformis]MBM9616495.1 MinD/ParA family protein [Desulfobulbus rhabdoformis]